MQKRFEMAQERISLLESENSNSALTNSLLRIELETEKEESRKSKDDISRLESEKNKSNESLDKFLQKLEKGLGIENAKIMNLKQSSIVSAWFEKKILNYLPTPQILAIKPHYGFRRLRILKID